MDDAQNMTDSRMRIIRQRLAAEYKQAGRELKKQVNEYYADFKAADLKKRELVKQGKLSQADYIKWRENKMLYGETLKQKVDVMSQHLLNVDKQAAGIINREMFGVYANNYNFAKYQVEKGLHIDTSFTLFDRKTVERMADKNPKLLRERKTKDGKILKWSRRKVNTAITQGVLQGESIDKIAKRLVDVVGMQERYALTNARTAMTAAQNAGRMDSYLDSAALGIKLKKQWMATLDERTRSSHQELDGEIVDINKPFSNKLMYPGDPDGAPAEIYNCRCTMVGELDDYPSEKFQRYDNIEGKPIDNVTYKEWAAAKQKAASAKNQMENVAVHTKNTAEYEELKKYAKSADIEYRNVEDAAQRLTSDEIIDKLAGGDMTTGSCASLAFAYCGNHHGLDITDFRGGKSQQMFSNLFNIDKMFKVSNAEVLKYEVEREAKDVAKILANIEKDKLYYLTTGKHATIIRYDSAEGLQYLELQSSMRNGFMPFKTDSRSVEQTLQRRFGCRKTIDRINIGGGQKLTILKKTYLVDIDTMQMTPEFREMMGYINTSTGKQRKGAQGGRK